MRLGKRAGLSVTDGIERGITYPTHRLPSPASVHRLTLSETRGGPILVVTRNWVHRWGRAQETYGEDPMLTGHLGAAYIQGMQGSDSKYIQTVATPKHFDGYGGATTRGKRSPLSTLRVCSWQGIGRLHKL